ncbi:UNVERIFIED_CONTAM: Rho GTPase-activating protein 15 [Siphonaria sp. JEL0065]|nr:Rho GTPase-activating protein 15 [Siphonaria sp. JEL0065]
MRERHTVSECENVIARVFTKSRPPLGPNNVNGGGDTGVPVVGAQLRMDALGKSGNGGNGSGPVASAARRSLNMFSGGGGGGPAKDRQSDGNLGKKFPFFGSGKKAAAAAAAGKAVPEAVRPELPFGGLLETQLQFEGAGKLIPYVVELCIMTVEARGGIEAQGIYRLSGNAGTIGKLKLAFNHGENIDLSTEDDINVVTGLLKSYFRELQNPLIPYEVYDQFIASSKLTDYNERLIQLKTLIQTLPSCNYNVLSYLLKHLKKVAEKSEINKMEQSNLAIVFAPTLIRTPDGTGDAAQIAQQGYASMANMPFHNKLIESMIEQYDWVFDGSKD